MALSVHTKQQRLNAHKWPENNGELNVSKNIENNKKRTWQFWLQSLDFQQWFLSKILKTQWTTSFSFLSQKKRSQKNPLYSPPSLVPLYKKIWYFPFPPKILPLFSSIRKEFQPLNPSATFLFHIKKKSLPLSFLLQLSKNKNNENIKLEIIRMVDR